MHVDSAVTFDVPEMSVMTFSSTKKQNCIEGRQKRAVANMPRMGGHHFDGHMPSGEGRWCGVDARLTT
jgi:hypothetical protein